MKIYNIYIIQNGRAVIYEEEAIKIKKLFEVYLSGLSLAEAAQKAGIKRYHTSVARMLADKRYVEDKFYPPIISRDTFEKAQLERRRRAEALGRIYEHKGNEKKCLNFRFHASMPDWNNRGKKSIVWRCVSRLENTGLFCTASTILEDTLKEKIVEAINIAVSGKNSFLTILKKNIETVLSEDLDESTADIDKKLEELQTELIQKANSKEAYDNIVNEIYRLRDLRQETLSRNALRQDKRDRIAEMSDFLNTQTGDIAEFEDKLVRKLIEKAIVYDNRLVVEFKSGLEIKVKL
jgi:hypothetical protein